ncbi:FMN-binding negative transcriptional regulator [Spiractinospora alimapuensis]|uniref:FMN-binding negative transcriptional regulator n=1 Tax=Spiractinospora alimapuensis TaxID=2820884 RepID=UPI001F3697DE|nr:FMN-binding negative transcriptional regulator [Spiractinospora alimapuensis]QVQ52673.1 FMN-binding negative transcriptional regulator [Spiractinospora alimapuensis]
MYVPSYNAVSDEQLRHLLVHHGAGDLVTPTADGLRATMLPLVYDPDLGDHGALLGHFARNNPHWQSPPTGESLVILRGPDAYVSPGWYETKREHGRVVPTWNYLTAHVFGELRLHDDPAWLDGHVRRLTDLHEATEARPWSTDDAPERFIAGQLRAIVGVELRISRIEARAKLSQNRSAADQDGVIEGLHARGDHASANAVRDARSG